MTHSESFPVLWGLVLTLHLLGMAIWVGGTAWVLFILRPSLALLDATPRVSAHLLALKRFYRLVWHVMPIVLLTGWAMAIFHEGGFAHLDWHINAMQGLGVLMALLFVYTFFGPFKRAQRALRPKPELLERLQFLAQLTLVLGVAVVLVASLGHFD